MTVSPFDHPLLSALVGDDSVAAEFSVASELAAMLAFERELAAAEAEVGVIPLEAGAAIGSAVAQFRPDAAALRAAVARDGVVVPELVRQLRAVVGDPHGARLHLGATSQDVSDTALVLRLKRVVAVLDARLASLIAQLDALEDRFGPRGVMAVTRMQKAIGITVSDRIASWRRPLQRHADRLHEQRARLLVVQFGGAAGTLDVLGTSGPAVRAALARRLELADAPQWHNARDTLAEFAGWLSLLTGSLGKLGQDIALMALEGSAIRLDGGGGSSAMPGKSNPVKAETLEALARFNAAQVGAVHQAIVHPLERSGAAWTLEWLVLPQMAVAAAASLRLAGRLVADIEDMGT